MPLILLFLLLTAFLSANTPNPHPDNLSLASLSSEPSSLIAGKVNAVTGDFVDFDQDMSIPGPERFTLQRTYCSGSTHSGMLGQSFGALYDHRVDVEEYEVDRDENTRFVVYKGDFGQIYDYGEINNLKYSRKVQPKREHYLKGVTNTGHGVLTSHNNPKEVCYLFENSTTFFPNGRRIYATSSYWRDRQPSGNSFCRDFVAGGKAVQLKNRQNLPLYRLEILGHEAGTKGFRQAPFILAYAPDRRFVQYNFTPVDIDKRNYYTLLTRVDRSDAPYVAYDWNLTPIQDGRKYGRVPRIGLIRRPNQRNLAIHYIDVGQNDIAGKVQDISTSSWRVGKVKRLFQPIGKDASLIPSYHFRYAKDANGGCTGVFDALMRLTNYTHDKNKRLTRIVKCKTEHAPYSDEQLFWGKESENEETFLKARAFGEWGAPSLHFLRRYHYDSKGNVKIEKLFGNLTGACKTPLQIDGEGRPLHLGVDLLQKEYSYSADGFNLLISERCGPIERTFDYLPDTNLLLRSLSRVNGKIFHRIFCAYNESGQEILRIEDDGQGEGAEDLQGATFRKIVRTFRRTAYPLGVPDEVLQSCLDFATGEERQLLRTRLEHDLQGRVTKKQVYGSDDQLFSTEEWTYDLHGNLLSYINPLGYATTYRYDENDNCIEEIGPDPLASKHYLYDYMNKLISTEFRYDGKSYFEKSSYDLVGNLIEKTDIYGNATTLEYDPFNRPVKVILPEVLDADGNPCRPVTLRTFNALGQEIEQIDAEGNKTTREFNLYGSPTRICHPDGSEETFLYDVEGRLVKSCAKNGTTTNFELDHLGRPVKQTVYDSSGTLLFTTEAGYSTFHLLWAKDALGTITYYSYDCFGRKIREEKEGRITEYTYNPQGLIEKTTVRDSSEGQTIRQEYDEMQQVTLEQVCSLSGEVITETSYAYDLMGNKCAIIQDTASGRSATYITYGAFNLPVQRQDADGGITTITHSLEGGLLLIETVDPQGFRSIQRLDALNRIVELLQFDPHGVPLKRSSLGYDNLGRCIKTTHHVLANGKPVREVINCTRYSPSGKILEQIDAYGRAEEQRTSFTYTPSGEKESTTKPDGTTLFYSYTALGKVRELKAPGIHYRYSYDSIGNPLLVENLAKGTHTTRVYDPLGRLLEETLENGLALKSSYTVLGCTKELTLPDQSSIRYSYNGPELCKVERLHPDGSLSYTHRYLESDLSGRATKSALIHNLGEETRSYTLKGQLQTIHSPYHSLALSYDGRGNVVRKNEETYLYDGLSQLCLETGFKSATYAYDSLNNRIEQDGESIECNALNQITSCSYDLSGNLVQCGTRRFGYDSLDRLTSIEEEGVLTTFAYDPFDRCITTTEGGKVEHSLYLQNVEIALADSSLALHTLRVLGKGLKADAGAAVAIEIGGKAYAPLHDQVGSVVCLIDSSGSIAARYNYTAFGESLPCESPANPWRFQSKRQQGSILLFGLRAYSPSLGRFLSRDPAGYAAGPNPYAFLENNPLSRIDPFGLKQEPPNLYDRTHDAHHWESGENRNRETSRPDEKNGAPAQSLPSPLALIGFLFRHVIFIPPIQDFLVARMHYMTYGCNCELKLWKDSVTSTGSLRLNQVQQHIRIVLFTGMNTSHQEAVCFAYLLSAIYGGENVDIVHNGDHGTLADAGESCCQFVGIPMNCDQVAYEFLKERIDNLGGPGNGGILKIIAFSQGALTFYNGAMRCTSEERGMMHVNTYGPATIIPTGDFMYVKNSISNRDPIPLVSFFKYIAARLGFMPNVEFVPALETHWGFDHSFAGATYQTEMKKDADAFMETFYR